jgi:hypothetical protein
VTLRVNKGGQPLVAGVSHSTAESAALRQRMAWKLSPSVIEKLMKSAVSWTVFIWQYLEREFTSVSTCPHARQSARIRHALDSVITRGQPT